MNLRIQILVKKTTKGDGTKSIDQTKGACKSNRYFVGLNKSRSFTTV